MARSEDTSHLRALYTAVRAVIRTIPRGRVATYGQVAELAGIPRGARIAAAALKVSRPNHGLPWQRVIGKHDARRGRIAIQDPIGAALQRQLLEREGVVLDERGLIDLRAYQWRATGSRGRGAPPRRRPRSGSTSRASPSRR